MKISQSIIEEMITFRRWMHKNPELSEYEKETSNKIHEILASHGIKHKCNVGGYGIEAVIYGGQPGKTVAAKTDIDALPIQEEWQSEYMSTKPGVMHACGHDANTAILLGTAILLKEMEASLCGNVKFFFECAEETIGGGELMVGQGCMENPHVDEIIGIHVMPYIDTGKIEIKKGCLNASTDEVEITVYGISGHAAEPEKCIDPIVVMAYIITSLQTLVSRNTAATNSAVLTFGMMRAGTKGNIIPEKAFIRGTMRTLLPKQREKSRAIVKNLAESIARGFGARAEVNIIPSYDALINDDGLTELVIGESQKYLGEDSVVIKEAPSMGAEDFSFYTKNAKGVYFHVGCRESGETNASSIHTAKFHIDEACIEKGILIQTAVLLKMLEEGKTDV